MLAHEVKAGDFIKGLKVRSVFRAHPYDVIQGWVRISYESGPDSRHEWRDSV